jgi:hypothetical protein
MNAPWITIQLPIETIGGFPAYGRRINFTDNTNPVSISGYMRIRGFTINILDKMVTVEGDGEVNFS